MAAANGDGVMRFFGVPLLLFVLLLPSEVLAQSEDQRLLCPVISEQLAMRIAAQIKGSGGCQAFCTGCGCKGGPGYRDQRGQCVGYAQLIAKCGPPPHEGCVRECAPVTPNCVGHVFGRTWLKGFAASVGLALDFLPSNVPEAK